MILEMQWILNRVVAMSGAARVKDGFATNDDDDDEVLKEGGDFDILVDASDSESEWR